jgi:hypothetical protein
LKRDKRGSLSFAMIFLFLAIMLTSFFALAVPLMININSHFFEAGQSIIESGISDFDISDADVEAAITGTMSDAADSTSDQISILATFYQYAWIIIIAVVAFVIFIVARSTVEVNGRSGLV